MSFGDRTSSGPIRAGFTVMELLVVVAIMTVLSAVSYTVIKGMGDEARLARATQKIRDLGSAFVGYTTDSGGLLPYEDLSGADNWDTARRPEASEVWYNALPRLMGYPSVGDLADNPEQFYQDTYPLYVPGAPYPKEEARFKKPYFAIAMNSRLQRKDEEGEKAQGTLASILDPVRTVAFLERGLPGEKKISKAQRGFNGKPKANPRAFAARHNQKGLLLFVDGHTEVRRVSDVIDKTGRIAYPQTHIIWTRNPDDDPN